MAEFDIKKLDGIKFNNNFSKLNLNSSFNHACSIAADQERIMNSIQRSRDEKEKEELRRHNEIVNALKEAGEKGATIVIGDNANGIQIQQNADNSSQNMTNYQGLDYEKTIGVLKEIKSYFDFPQFANTYGDNTENLKEVVEDTLLSLEKNEDEGLIKKSLSLIKDLTIGVSGSLIASGILALLGTLPI